MGEHRQIGVTVAGYGPDAVGINPFEGPTFENHEDGVRWEERQQVTIRVDPDATLSVVVDSAAESMGIRVVAGSLIVGRDSVSERISGIAFYDPEDDQPGGSPYPWANYFVQIDEQGIASWGQAHEVTVGGLVRAAERGLLRGDPTRIYLRLTVPQGGEVFLGDWSAIVAGLESLWHVLETVASAYGVVELLGKLKGKLTHREAITDMGRELRDRGAGPIQLLELLKYQRLTTEEVSALLGLSTANVESLLHGLGYAKTITGEWERGSEIDEQFLARFTELVAQGSLPSNPDGIQQFLTARLTETVESDELAPTSTWRARWFSSFEPLEPAPVEQLEAQPEIEVEDGAYERTISYEVLAVHTDEGIDVDALTASLNNAGARGLELCACWEDQLLANARRGHVVILKRDSWASG